MSIEAFLTGSIFQFLLIFARIGAAVSLIPGFGEAYVAVEHPKGENGYYVVSDGTSIPYRFRIRSPDFVNLGVLPYVANGAMLADVVALIGTIDIVLGSVDR